MSLGQFGFLDQTNFLSILLFLETVITQMDILKTHRLQLLRIASLIKPGHGVSHKLGPAHYTLLVPVALNLGLLSFFGEIKQLFRLNAFHNIVPHVMQVLYGGDSIGLFASPGNFRLQSMLLHIHVVNSIP